MDEQEIRYFLNRFRDNDVLNIAHRKAFIDMLVNKIYLYDDHDGGKVIGNTKITIIFNAGKDTVEITEDLYADIKQKTQGEKICTSPDSGHQQKNRLTLLVKRFFNA